MVLAFEVIGGEADGESLLVGRVGLLAGVKFVGFEARFAAGDELRARQRQQVPQFRGVDNQGASRSSSRPVRRLHTRTTRTESPMVLADTAWCSNKTVSRPPLRAAASIASRTARATRGSWHSRETEPLPGFRWTASLAESVSGVVAAVVVANTVAQCPIGAGAALRFDPGVFVGRDGLLGELATQPVGFFGQHNRQPRRAERPGLPHNRRVRRR